VKLSVVILCWNDKKVITDCLQSIFANTRNLDFEVIVSDNGSTDGCPEFSRAEFPQVRLIENGANLRFAKGNNVAINVAQGEYILILNPDTIIHEGALEGFVAFADKHPKAGAFGCRVLNADGSYQGCIWPFPTPRSEWIRALGLKWLGYISEYFQYGAYIKWHGETEREIGWPAGCCILARGELLKRLGGFDEQFFYCYEDTDLCRRIWDAGYPILYTPSVSITHLVGQSTNKKFKPIGFAIDLQVTRYLYFYKYYGARGARNARLSALATFGIRTVLGDLMQIIAPNDDRKQQLELSRALLEWNYRVDPVRLVEKGEEPELRTKPLDRVAER
jgi:GT2 family glycosyltransferase